MSWKVTPGTVKVEGQHVPDDFAGVLVDLYLNGRTKTKPGYALLNQVLADAHRDGWTLIALAEPLCLTRERVRQRIAAADDTTPPEELPPIPDPPRWAEPERRVVPDISDGMVAWLRHMSDIARTVNGCTPLDSPSRGVSECFTAVLADLYDRGVYASRLGQAAGVTRGAIHFRLRRHGYRRNAPSQPSYRRMMGGFPRRAVEVAPPGVRYQRWLEQQHQVPL